MTGRPLRRLQELALLELDNDCRRRWGDIERIDVARIQLRQGFERGSPELRR
jgi:hypothetical protein